MRGKSRCWGLFIVISHTLYWSWSLFHKITRTTSFSVLAVKKRCRCRFRSLSVIFGKITSLWCSAWPYYELCKVIAMHGPSALANHCGGCRGHSLIIDHFKQSTAHFCPTAHHWLKKLQHCCLLVSFYSCAWNLELLGGTQTMLMYVVCRNVLSSQEVVDFINERIKPDESGHLRSLSSIIEEVRPNTFIYNVYHLNTINFFCVTD